MALLDHALFGVIHAARPRSEERRVGKECRDTRCLSDWSSDVCSSDLPILFLGTKIGEKSIKGRPPFSRRLPKQLALIYCLTSGASAWPGSTRLTESNGTPRSRTFRSNPCSAA